MKVIGIDPAPTKGLSVFDGSYRHIPLRESRAFIEEICHESNVLLCWDSPLTGPPLSAINGGEASGSAFSKRPIEKFFSQIKTGFKTPPGISVLGYSGCPHWALSRSLIGLPRTGPYDSEALPFFLTTSQATRPTRGRVVVEVHPALALWLWCSDRGHSGPWDYKKDAKLRDNLWAMLMGIPHFSESLGSSCLTPGSDDEMDAQIAFVLGRLWLTEPSRVTLLGDEEHGTFLLPNVKNLEAAFIQFCETLSVT